MRSFALMFTSTALAGALLGGCADGGMFGKSSTATPSTAAQQASAERQPSAEVRDVQRRLQSLGYYDGTVDGLWGPDTQIAVREYQRDRGLTVSSALDNETRASLSRESGQDRMAERRTESRSQSSSGTAAGTTAGTTGTAGQQAGTTTQGEYIGRQQVGQNTGSQGAAGTSRQDDEARRMQDISPAAGPGAGARAVSPRNLNQDSVRNVQQKLADEGQYQADVDGVWGPQSQKALVNFQTQNGLRADGVIGPKTANALGLDLQQLSANTGTRGMGGGSMDSGGSTGSGSGAMSPGGTTPGSTSPGSASPGSTGPGSTNGGSGSMSPGNTGSGTNQGGTGSGTGPSGGSPQQ